MSTKTRHVILVMLLGASAAACSESTGPRSLGSTSWTNAAASTPAIILGDVVALAASSSAGFSILDTETGRRKFTVGAPLDASQPSSGLYAATGGVLVDARIQFTTLVGTSRVYDGSDGRLLLTIPDHSITQRVLGLAGNAVISVRDDSVLVANTVGAGTEVWRIVLPRFDCTPFPCSITSVDAVGAELLLLRTSEASAALIRVNSRGVVSTAPALRDAFRSRVAPQYAPRSGATDPLVIATDRSLTVMDPLTGEVVSRTLYQTIRPAGSNSSSAILFHLTRDGRWLTALFLDSTGFGGDGAREVVLRTADGSRVRERSFAAGTAGELFRGSCGPSGAVRVRNDLSVEYTDVSTGRINTSPPVPALAALRSTATTGGFVESFSTVTPTHIVVYNRLAQPTLVGVQCAP